MAKEAIVGGAVQVEGIPDPRVDGGDDAWGTIHGDREVTEHGLIQNGMDGLAVVDGSFGIPLEPRSFRGLRGRVGTCHAICTGTIFRLRWYK